MGSFHTTCAISHSPIREGDKVRLFFLASNVFYNTLDPKRPYTDGTCYPWEEYTVIGGVSIPAEYSDYNTYEFDESCLQARFVKKLIRTNYVMNTVEDAPAIRRSELYDIPAESLDWETIFEMIHRNALFVKGYIHNYPKVEMMAIHESVYNVLMNENHQVYVGWDEPYKTMNFQIGLQEELKRDRNVELVIQAQAMRYIYEEDLKNGTMTEEDVTIRTMDLAKNRFSTRSETRMEFAYGTADIYCDILNNLEIHNQHTPDDVIEFDPKEIEAIDFESKYFNSRFFARNFMYRPIMTSGQEHDLVADGVFWNKVAGALGTIGSSWEEEEHVVTEKVTQTFQKMHIADIYKRYEEWQEDTTEIAECLEGLFADAGTDTEVIVTVEELKLPENEVLRELLWNPNLDLHLSCAHRP